MNSMPICSSAVWIAAKDLALPVGTPDINSKRLIVATPIPEACPSSLAVTRNMWRAALI
jgi:hypothetical protein